MLSHVVGLVDKTGHAKELSLRAPETKANGFLAGALTEGGWEGFSKKGWPQAGSKDLPATLREG